MMPSLRLFMAGTLLCLATVTQAGPRIAARCPDVAMPEWTPDTAALDAQFEKISPLTTALGRPQRLAQLLASGSDPNRCIYSVSILSMAATLGHADSVRQLLAAGASVDRPLSADGDSALLHALSSGHFAVAEELLGHGANPRRTTKFGTTALHALAAGLAVSPANETAATLQSGQAQLQLAERLLARGVPLDTRDRQGRTPLFLTAVYGRTDLVRLLLSHGANPDTRNRRGDSALSFAERKGNAVMAELLRARSR